MADPVTIVGTTVAVIALVIGMVAVMRTTTTSGPSTVTSTVAAPPTLVTQRSTVTVTPPPPLPPPPSTSTMVVPVPVPPAPPQVPPRPMSACQMLPQQARIDYEAVADMSGMWVPQLSSKQLGRVADGITWNCDSIWAEHTKLRFEYNGDLLWSGDWPHTYGHDDYWVTIAAYTFPTADGARQWCRNHGRDVPEHCYPTQIR
jgi:serine/threonine kinase PknH